MADVKIPEVFFGPTLPELVVFVGAALLVGLALGMLIDQFGWWLQLRDIRRAAEREAMIRGIADEVKRCVAGSESNSASRRAGGESKAGPC